MKVRFHFTLELASNFNHCDRTEIEMYVVNICLGSESIPLCHLPFSDIRLSVLENGAASKLVSAFNKGMGTAPFY